MPFYNEIASIPLFILDPRYGKYGESRSALVQIIDMPPTLLNFFGFDIPKDMQGKPLGAVIESDCRIRDCALYGLYVRLGL
jgi:arylsulfatase A-like enzyme